MSDFLGFTFCDIHSSKFNILSVSNGSRYSQSLFADFTDYSEKVMGMDGVYYFGTDIDTKPFSINCFVEGINESQLRGLQAWLSPRRIGKLVLDESPYKYYNVKIASTPQFDFVPLYDSRANCNIYSGELVIEFTSFVPYGFSFANTMNDYNENNPQWFKDSGILYKEYTPPSTLNNITTNTTILLYNAGNFNAKPIITITGSADNLTLLNNTTKQNLTLKNLQNQTIIVDCVKGRCMVGDILANSYHSGGFLEICGSNKLDYLNVKLTSGSALVTLNSGNFDNSMIGRYIAVGNNNWFKIQSLSSPTVGVLNKQFVGVNGNHNATLMDLNEISLTGSGLNLTKIIFEYQHTYL